MRLVPKLAAISLLIFIPLTVTSVLLVQEAGRQLDTTLSEIDGTAVFQEVHRVHVLVDKHRLHAALALEGDSGAKAALASSRLALATTVASADQALSAASALGLQSAWAPLGQRLTGLGAASDAASGGSAVFALHGDLLADLRRFNHQVGNASALLFEREAGPYLAVEMATARSLTWSDLLGQLQAIGRIEAARPQASVAAVQSLRLRHADLRSLVMDLRRLDRGMPGHQLDSPDLRSALSETEALLEKLGPALAEGSTERLTPAHFSLAVAAQEAVLKAQQSFTSQLVTSLRARASSLRMQRWLMMGSTLAGLGLVAYLMAAFLQSLVGGMRFVTGSLDRIATGDLQLSLKSDGRDEWADMLRTLQETSTRVSAMVAEVRSSAALVAFSGSDLVRGNRDLADRTEQQAASLEQTSASMQDLQETVRLNAETAAQADQRATQVRSEAEGSAAAMEAAITSVEAIQHNARRMNEIIGVIDSLAFQTNILALNAAVEAARAGEQGRGFAVVASEVRLLAQRSAESAKEIRALIQTSGQQVEASVAGIKTAGGSIRAVAEGIRSVASSVNHIAAATNAQSISLREVSSAMQQLDQITQQNAQMVQSAVAQATQLETRAESLADAVSTFKLKQGTADEATALVKKAQLLARSVKGPAFLEAITAKDGGYHDRDMYVFALDRTGTYRAFGGNAAKLGTRVQDIPGVDGQGLLDAIVQQAEQGDGWVQYDITNPATGRVQRKMSYVTRVNELYVGCGVYMSLVA